MMLTNLYPRLSTFVCLVASLFVLADTAPAAKQWQQTSRSESGSYSVYGGTSRPPSRPPGGGGGKVLGTGIDIEGYRRRTLQSVPQSQPQQNLYLWGNPGSPSRQRYTEPRRTNYNNDSRQYYRSNNNDYVPSRSYSAPRESVAKVKANAKPKEKVLEPRHNEPLEMEGFETIDSESQQLVSEILDEHMEKSLDALEESLGDVAAEEHVKKQLDYIRKKIAAGVQVTADDVNHLNALINLNDSTKYPAGYNPAEAMASLNDVVKMSEASTLLKQESMQQGDMIMPTGIILAMPALPEDDLYLMPGGGLIMGTGGEGEISISDQHAAEVLGINLGIGEPAPESESDVAKRPTEGTYLMNPRDNGASIKYVVNNKSYTMKPGFAQELSGDREWTIRFDTGDGDEEKYKLGEGTYMFGEKDGVWDLFKHSFGVTIDNSDNESTFYVNIDNSQEEIGPGEKETFRSKYPILVRFDRGDDETAQKKVMKKNEQLIVAASPSDGLWDLYPGKNYEGIARKSDSKKTKLRQTLLREKLKLSLGRSD